MQNKLQELTDKLYAEGLSKGKQEGEEIVAKAKAEAQVIIAKANAEAEDILAKAGKEAEDIRTKVTTDVRMAAEQTIATTRQDIENLLVAKMSTTAVKSALSDVEFAKEVIRTVAEKFSTEESADLALILPESLKAELEPFVSTELSAKLGRGIEASFSRKVAGGFQIGPKDGGWFISLTDETFAELIGAYLRPATKKILFG